MDDGTGDTDGNHDIYTMNADGSNQTRLTFNDEWVSSPAWSPDGAHITFTSNRDGHTEIYTTRWKRRPRQSDHLAGRVAGNLQRIGHAAFDGAGAVPAGDTRGVGRGNDTPLGSQV